MRKILLTLGVLISNSAFADNVNLSEMHFNVTNLHPDKYIVLCNKNKCNYYTSNVQNYLVSIQTTDGKAIKDQIKEETIIEAALINQQEKNILKIIYKEKSQAGYFNDQEKIDPFLSNGRGSAITNNEKIFYLPVKTDKKYNVKIDDDKNIDVILK